MIRKNLLLLLTAGMIAAATPAMAGLSLLRDAETEEGLKTFSTPIFQAAGLSPDTVQFVIVNDPNLNAFVAGGQNIFINTGLLLETKDPSELIGVIAHESGHIADGHLFRTQEVVDNLTFEAMLGSLLGVAGAAAAGSGQGAMAAVSAGNSIAQRLYLRHSRVQETSADQAGTKFLREANLPVTGFLSFMQKMSSQELLPESQQSEYVRTHPLTSDRIDFLQHIVDSAPKTGTIPPAWTEMHTRMKSKLEGYLYPERALAKKDDSVATKYGRVMGLYRQAKSAEALALLETLIVKEPQNPYFQELKGQILFESGKVADSIAPYQKAVALDPKSGLIRAAYGHALLETDNPRASQEAVKQLQLSIASEPKIASTHRFLGIAYGKLGQEGLSRVQLAEAGLMMNNLSYAKSQALLAQKALPKNSPGYLKAGDILDQVKKRMKDKDKNGG